MKIKIKGVEWDVDPGRLTFAEGIQIEKTTGLTFTQFGEKLEAGSMEAMASYVFILLRRSDPAARFADVEAMNLDDFEFITEPGDPGYQDDPAAVPVPNRAARRSRRDPTPPA